MLTKAEHLKEGDLILVPFSSKLRCLKILKLPKAINGSFKCSYYRRPMNYVHPITNVEFTIYANEFNSNDEEFNSVGYFKLQAYDVLTLRTEGKWLLRT